VAVAFADGYRPGADDWVGQIRRLAAGLGFAPSQKAYKQNPAAYPGSIVAVFGVIRVLLTGTSQSPGLASVATTLGAAEVLRRVRALTGPAPTRRGARPR
jgi:glutamyl-tRNA synthetase